MKPAERDDLVRDIARRIFDEEACGRRVDEQRLIWAAAVLDHHPTALPARPRQSRPRITPKEVSHA